MAQLKELPPLPKQLWHEALTEALDTTGDIAAEQTWQILSKLLARHWDIFERRQSPLSTWGMLAKCGEMVLRIRSISRQKEGGEETLKQFRDWMQDIMGEPDPLERVED